MVVKPKNLAELDRQSGMGLTVSSNRSDSKIVPMILGTYDLLRWFIVFNHGFLCLPNIPSGQAEQFEKADTLTPSMNLTKGFSNEIWNEHSALDR